MKTTKEGRRIVENIFGVATNFFASAGLVCAITLCPANPFLGGILIVINGGFILVNLFS